MVRLTVAVLLGALSAYALSFAADIFVSGLRGALLAGWFLPVCTWMLVAMLAFVASQVASNQPLAVLVGYVAIAALATVGAAVGNRRQSAPVALVMIGASAFLAARAWWERERRELLRRAVE